MDQLERPWICRRRRANKTDVTIMAPQYGTMSSRIFSIRAFLPRAMMGKMRKSMVKAPSIPASVSMSSVVPSCFGSAMMDYSSMGKRGTRVFMRIAAFAPRTALPVSGRAISPVYRSALNVLFSSGKTPRSTTLDEDGVTGAHAYIASRSSTFQ
ncbi:MAG: hypothetical protein A4E34_02813 [Methanoregula sp. PtaU1.Bin006]|nr:MAG: hypothetical protein A4E34_02813 [Methanoregula sp. PtaU1.Bin006]